MELEIISSTYGIDDQNLQTIADDAKDFAISKGMLMRRPDLPYDARVPLSFCVVPSQFPLKWFEIAKEIQPYINSCLAQISRSKSFIKECLASTLEADEFTSNIFKIYEKVEEEGCYQTLSLGLIRTDYLLNCDSLGQIIGMKQVENNTIASSFGGLSPSVRDLHMFTLERLGIKDFEGRLPLNESVHELAKGIISAWDAYENASAIVLVVLEDLTLNICDQRALEHALLEFESRIQIVRCTFKELRTRATLKSHFLLVDDKEVAVVYYRCGYVPQHYEPEDWEVRYIMECSRAIKCPSVGLHLAGSKSIQAHLTRPGVLEKFISDPTVVEVIRQVFAAQYSLEMTPEGDKAMTLAIENPEKFVLKPEREGGGNNIYGAEIKTLLEEIGSSHQRQAYILMERINPPAYPNCLIRYGAAPKVSSVITELGIFGVILTDKENVWVNNEAGHLLRSKEVGSDESGVAAGFGYLDSPYFI